MIPEDETPNFQTFQDCLSSSIIQKLAPDSGKKKRAIKGRKNEFKPVEKGVHDELSDAGELADFVEYLAEEIFTSLVDDLRTLSYAAVQANNELAPKYEIPIESATMDEITSSLPLSIADSLTTYGVIEEEADLSRFLEPVISAYTAAVVAPPPEYTPELTQSRPDGCEICQREHLPLTYHHLIPRQVHGKAIKRGWHSDWELNKVAWLCRACHSHVHRIASNEQLAREFHSVDLLMEREDMQRWAAWIGRVRWKAR